MKAVIKNNLTQGQGLSATQKLSLLVGSASVLYLLPTEADAAIIHVTPVTPPTIKVISEKAFPIGGNRLD